MAISTRSLERTELEESNLHNEQLSLELQHAKAQLVNLTNVTRERPLPQGFATLRQVAKLKLEERIHEAYCKFDTSKLIESIEERLIGEALDIADKLMGIDRKWHEPEIKEGRIRQIIQADVDALIEEKAKPLILAEMARVLELKTVKKALQDAIKIRVNSAIRNIETSYNSDISKRIDALVAAELDAVFVECTKSSQKD
jgi:hypothetical protein